MPPVTCTQGGRIQLFRRRSYVHIGKVVTSAKTGEASRERDTTPSPPYSLFSFWDGKGDSELAQKIYINSVSRK